MQGRKAKFVPGWDCHGLPIELKVLQVGDAQPEGQDIVLCCGFSSPNVFNPCLVFVSSQSMKDAERRSLTPLQLRKKAAEFALKTVDAQREQFKRYAPWRCSRHFSPAPLCAMLMCDWHFCCACSLQLRRVGRLGCAVRHTGTSI